MLGLKYEDIIERIKEEKNLSEEEIEIKVKQKLTQLSDLISKQGAAHIIANELGINLFDGSAGFKINRLAAGMRSVGVVGKVVKSYGVREFKTVKAEGKVANLLIGDESGVVKLVLWDTNHIQKVENGEIKEESVVKIRNGYVKENNGYKEVHLGNAGQIELSDEKIKVKPIGERPDASKKQIKDLKEGDMNVGVFGTVVQLFEPKFFGVCKECNKKVLPDGDKFRCEEHGVVTPEHVPVLNFFFDDGTENIRCVAFRDQANDILGMSKDDVVKFKDDISGFENIKNTILGKQVEVTGRIVKNTMFDRLEMIANRVEEPKPEEMVKKLENDVSNSSSV
jgi:replication factor A1